MEKEVSNEEEGLFRGGGPVRKALKKHREFKNEKNNGKMVQSMDETQRVQWGF